MLEKEDIQLQNKRQKFLGKKNLTNLLYILIFLEEISETNTNVPLQP